MTRNQSWLRKTDTVVHMAFSQDRLARLVSALGWLGTPANTAGCQELVRKLEEMVDGKSIPHIFLFLDACCGVDMEMALVLP